MSNHVATLVAGVAALCPLTQLHAERISLQKPTATISQAGGWNASLLTDGTTNDYAGWAVYDFARGGAFAETAVMETSTNVGFANGSLLTFVLYHVNHNPQHGLGRFRLSYTTDSRDTFADGQNSNGDVSANWIVLTPKAAMSTGGESMTIQADGSVLVGGTNPAKTIYTVTAEVMAEGITGFRIEALESPSLPASGPGRYPSNGNFVLTEITADISPLNIPPPPPTKIVLTNFAATFSQQSGWNAALIVDGVTNDFAGWAVYDFSRGGAFAETVVVETLENVGHPSGSRLTFNLYHVNHNPQHGLGRFRLSYTTDSRDTFADGLNSGGDVTATWIVITPKSASGTGGETFTIQPDGSILVSGANPTKTVYTVTAELAAQDITGFRIEALEDPSLPSSGPGRYPSNGNFVLTEFTAAIAPLGNPPPPPPPPPPEPAPVPDGLVAWWPLDGNAVDKFTRNNGTLLGSPIFNSGKVGQAMLFDGGDDSIRIARSRSINVGLREGFTVEGWIYPTDLGHLRPLAEWNNGNIGVHFWTGVDVQAQGDGTRNLFANLIDTSGISHQIRSPKNLLSENSWQHVALSYDKTSGIAKILHNGLVVAETNLGSFTPDTRGNLYFGNRPSGPFAGIYWKGAMDEMTLYRGALSNTDLLAIFIAGVSGKSAPTNPPPANAIPVAEALAAPLFTVWPEQTNLQIIAVNGRSASAVLDGSLSSDADGDPLSFLWLKDDEGSPFASTVITTNLLSAGIHHVTLIVDDGEDDNSDTLEIEIITLGEALEEIYTVINESGLQRKDKRPLFATLDRITEAFNDGRLHVGVRQLNAFQQKIRAQVAGQNPELADRLRSAAGQIVDAVEAYLESVQDDDKDKHR